MKKHILFTGILLLCQLALAQWTQLGIDIDGEAVSDMAGRVSINADGSRVAIGAPFNDDNGNNAGHVRIYEIQDGNWVQLGQDIDGEAVNDQSGWSVSLSGNGSRVAIGAHWNDGTGMFSGHIRVYEYQGGNWVQLGTDIDGEAVHDTSGSAVSLSSDGSRVAIGARLNNGNGTYSGHVRVYEYQDGNWVQLGADIDGEADNDESGSAVSLSNDGSRVAIGAVYNDGNGGNSGHVRIYELQGGNWNQLGADIDGEAANDESGSAVSLSNDGNRIAIGAPYNDGNGSVSGHVRVYELQGGNWVQLGADIDGEAAADWSGYSVNLSSDGTIVAIGAQLNDGNGTYSGHVRIYEYQDGNWVQLGADIDGEAAGDRSGSSVSLSADGSIVAVGAYRNDDNGGHSGHVRVFFYFEEGNLSTGNQSGQHITTGTHNAFFGDYSGFSTTEGSNNTFLGDQSGFANTTGNNNTYIGKSAGFSNQTGAGNVFLGHHAGYNETGSGLLYIDNSDTTSPLIRGDFANDSLRVNGIFSIANIPQDDGLTQVAVADGNGVMHWRDVGTIGNDDLGNHQVLQDLLPDSDNTYNLGMNGNAFNNIYFDGALFVNDTEFLHSRDNNIALGIDALGSVSGGSQNTAIGEEALTGTTTGVNNVAMGYRALYNNTTGSNNTAVGNSARVLWSTASNSTAIGNGALALGSNQIRIGNSSITSIGGYANWSNLSDGRFKTNVREDVPGLDFIAKLRPVSYEVDQAKLQAFRGEEATTSQPNKKAIGFIAQEIEEIVDENNYMFTGVEKPQNEKDHYSIRYAEFVVPLTKAIQELSDLVETQQQRIETLEGLIYGADSSAITRQTETTENRLEGFVLHQNTPNPFSQTTTIRAVVPEQIQQAKIIVYNLQGIELASYDLNKRGNVSIEISGSVLPSGIYLYALIADDQIIDTKKMILTK